MKISEIVEAIDQKEADELLKSLVAVGDPVAKYFQQTRYDTRHTTIDSAQRAAERMWHKEQRSKEPKNKSTAEPTVEPKSKFTYTTAPKTDKDKQSPDWGDDFYGNRYTGSLNKGRSFEPGDLGKLMGVDPDSFIGRTAGAISKVKKPISTLAKAFKIGVDSATKR